MCTNLKDILNLVSGDIVVAAGADVDKVVGDSRQWYSWQSDGLDCGPSWSHEEDQLH